MQDPQPTILSLDVGDVLLGRYRLERIIGLGGMGAVWLAADITLDHTVAIKVLPAVLSRDKRAAARLKEEARRNLALTHPHIVRLHTFEQDPARADAAFLVMQYIEGHTLNDLLADHPGGLPLEEVEPWAEQIAAAIDFAHAKGILHRDIKPGNIIIEASTGLAYLMDFGIACEARDTMTRVTGQQDSSGTLPYMSPQQLMGRNHSSNDIYSFAATLYEALCGEPPFTTGDIAYQIREVAPEPPAGVVSELSAALLAGLAKQVEDRPSSCHALLSGAARSTVAPPGAAGPAHLARKQVEFAPGVVAEFVYIDAPTVAPDGFLMGSPASEEDRHDIEVQHRVKLTRGYWMQTTEVTQDQWTAVMGSNPSRF
ncbi:MAG: protein kinase, partial [Phycisphaerales bacterium]|nr:protein kinase [Phycisphaerales bacterium]